MNGPDVKLIEYTGKGRRDEQWHAANLLVFTKSTRLSMTPGLLDRIQNMPHDEIKKELEYMAGTIPSSWEFVDLTFLISGVSRACAQQITRTRTASFAMQSQRVTDVADADVTNPCDPNTPQYAHFKIAAEAGMDRYARLLDHGLKPQEARGVLPMNVQCNLVAKYNLRSLVELVLARKSMRTQGEYADIVEQMESLVVEAWPWAKVFFEPKQAKAIAMLEGVVDELGLETGKGAGWQVAKAIDLIRKG